MKVHNFRRFLTTFDVCSQLLTFVSDKTAVFHGKRGFFSENGVLTIWQPPATTLGLGEKTTVAENLKLLADFVVDLAIVEIAIKVKNCKTSVDAGIAI